MSQIAVHRYELKIPGNGVRHGALLKLRFDGIGEGYADCHPWPELGDLEIEAQIARLAKGNSTSLTDRSRQFASLDAMARHESRNLFESLPMPLSHASMPFGLCAQDLPRLSQFGFTRVKVKAPFLDAERLSSILPALRELGIQLRWDVNERLSFDEVFSTLEDFRIVAKDLDWLDWVEDPCPFDATDWRALKSEFGIRIALDRPFVRDTSAFSEDSLDSFDVLVVKPAVSDPFAAAAWANERKKAICITSYLDHPLGQSTAAWSAGELLKRGFSLEQGGLSTQDTYAPTAFSNCLGRARTEFLPPGGVGFGFDELLQGLSWEDIVA